MAWSITASVLYRKGNYIKCKFAITSDGNALSATDLLALSPGGTGSIEKSTTQTGRTMRDVLEGVSLMAIKADPGSGGTAPDAAFDFTVSDEESDAYLTVTDASNSAISWHDCSTDTAFYPPILDKLYLAFPTAGDWSNNDTVDLYLIGWRENPF